MSSLLEVESVSWQATAQRAGSRRCRNADVSALTGVRRGGLAFPWRRRRPHVWRPRRRCGPPEPDAQRKAEASAHLKRGAELIDAENLQGALAEFEAAYRLVPSPSILHNFGVVYQGLGRKAAALDAFQRFLDEAAKAPPATREHAQQAVQTLRGEVAELRVEADVAGAGIFVDGGRSGRRRRKAHLPGPGASSRVRGEAGGGTVHAERVEASAGQQLTVAGDRRSPPPAAVAGGEPAPRRDRPREWQRPAAWTTAAAAAVAAGAFGGGDGGAAPATQGFNDTGCGTAELDRTRRLPAAAGQGPDAEKWAKVSGAAAGALGVGAALLFMTLPDAPLQVSLASPWQTLGLGLQGRF